MRRSWTLLIPLCVLGLGVFLQDAKPLFLRAMQLKVFDSYQAYHPRPYQPLGVSIVDIDEESLKRIGQWPWPRNILARLTDRLREEGAGVIAFDMVFPEPDRTSPKEILPLWGKEKELKSLLTLPDHDALLGAAMAQAKTVAGCVLTDENHVQPEIKNGIVFKNISSEADKTAALAYLRPFNGSVVNLPVIAQGAKGQGAFNSLPDIDGIIRRMPLLFDVAGTQMPSLSGEALRVAQGASSYLINIDQTDHAIESVTVGHFPIPTDKEAAFWIYFSPSVQERYVPAWQVLEKRLPEGRLDGHIVFIGTSAAGLKDIRATPLNPVTNGVEVHAQAVEQVLLGEFLTRPYWAEIAEEIGLVLTGLGMILLLQFVSPAYGAILGVMAVFGAVYGSWYAFTDLHLLFDPVIPSIVLIAVYLTETLRQFILSEKEKNRVRDAFSRYMSPALVEKLAANPGALKLGGEMREMTVLFSDIRGFTTLSEKYTAEELTRLINRFLTPMTDTILQYRGTIDKYMGDAIMAFWNAPLDNPAHVKDACLAALAMQQRLQEVNTALQTEAAASGKEYDALAVGIGINTGVCCVGNMGSEQRFDYSVLGDSVNLASRLEGQSKTYGVTVILGERTATALNDLAIFEIDAIRVKGKTEAVRIFTLLGDETLAARESFSALKRDFLAMLAAYRAQRFDEAHERISACRMHAAEAGLAIEELFHLYEERIQEYTLTPPPAGWDGVYVALSK